MRDYFFKCALIQNSLTTTDAEEMSELVECRRAEGEQSVMLGLVDR